MFKEIKTVKSGITQPVFGDQVSFPSAEPVDYNPSSEFLGFRNVKKGYTFRAKSHRWLPWRDDAPTMEWLIGDNLSELTKKWRKDFKVYLQASLDFKFYQMRPVSIPFVDYRGVRRVYEPAALLTYRNDDLSPKNRRSLLIDVWSDESIRSQSDILFPAFRAANRFAVKRRLRFKVFRDEFFLSDYFFNLTFIKCYIAHQPEDENWELIERILREKRIINFSELIDLLPRADKFKRGRIIFDIWVLVGMGEIGIDWNKRFNRNTLLWYIP